MSKPFGLMFFGFFMFFLIGNTLPIAKEGEMSIIKNAIEIREKSLLDRIEQFQGQGGTRKFYEDRLKRFRKRTSNTQTVTDAPVAQTVFGTVCVLFACLVVYVVTPKNEKYLLGLRRAKNLKKKWIPVHWDEAPGLLITLFVMGIMAAALFIFSSTLYQAPTMPESLRSLVSFIPTVCFFATVVVLVFYLVFEAWENRGLFMLILFVWVMPIMVAMVMAVQSSHWPSLVWVSSVSPIAAYGFGMSDVVALPMREAFYVSFGIQILIGGFASLALISKKLNGRKILLENTVD